MISSTANKQVKFVNALVKKAKTRREEGLFVAEGSRLFAEIPQRQLHSVYVSDSFLRDPAGKRLLEGVEGAVRVETVADEVFKAMSDTQSPQGILAVVRQLSYTLDDVVQTQSGPAQLLVLETLQDPGNVGTIIRAGEGAGVTGIVMDAGSADVWNPKVIRSTMGSVFRMPFVYVEDLPAALTKVKASGIRLYAAHLNGKHNYEKEDYTGNVGFLIGNEANGLSDTAAGMADEWVKIPMAGRVESLNAAVAASILTFETARQRRASNPG